MSRPSSRIQVLREVIADREETDRFNAAHGFLRSRLLATRDTAIGCDFLFAADAAGVSAALKDLVRIEHEHGKDLLFDYAEVGGYYLLRIAGTPLRKPDIDGYFS